jgi:hypothetical protein
MKKNPDSSDLAARLAAAASQPAGRSSAPKPAVASGPAPVPVLVSTTPAEKAPVAAAARPKAKKAKPPEPDTVPITIRPSRAVFNKFLIKATERTLEEGRVVSAQEIMMEALERSVL